MKLRRCVSSKSNRNRVWRMTVSYYDKQECRIVSISKDGDAFTLYVDVYSVGLACDEYEYSGIIEYNDITIFDPTKSVEDVKR